MDYYYDRLSGILSALHGARRLGKRPVAEVLKKEIGYGEQETILGSTEGWEKFGRFDTWGGRETHVCFRTTISIPEEWEGETVVVTLQTGVTDIWNTDNPQFLVYINGNMVCGQDMNHNEVILTDCAKAGEIFEYGLYAYSNSAARDVFLLLDTSVVQKQVEELYYDMKVPFEIASLLKADDIRRMEYFKLLNEAANRLNLCEVGSREFYDSVEEADRFLKNSLYADKERAVPVTVHSIGHTHIDVAWKWPLRQTREKVLRSFATVLYEMERYPEYKFMSSQPQLYQFVKEDCPELYEKIKARVAEGRWETEGAMWLEADCNLSSGESLIRQIVYGKRFFEEEFGAGDNRVLWLPDVFGYSAAMPQILKKSGIDYFMTTKIGWNEYNMIPNDTMLWQGIDGTEILTYFITTKNYVTDPELNKKPSFETTYNGRQNANQIMGTWQRYQNKDINNEVLTCFGYGDGGGGATVQMLEESRRMEYALHGCPKVKQTFVREFFEGLEQRLEGKRLPKWCGELYLEFHRGTYTSMARNKKSNRRAEFMNQDAESFSAFCRILDATWEYPRAKAKRAWELTLLNQFHDILPGSSIHQVYEDSKEQYEEIFRLDHEMTEQALRHIHQANQAETANENVPSAVSQKNCKETYVTLYNNTSFAREDAFESEGVLEIYDGEEQLPSQQTPHGTTVWKPRTVPQKGYRVFRINRKAASENEEKTASVFLNKGTIQVDLSSRTIETPYYRALLNTAWEFTSLYDKQAGREILKAGETGNALLAFEDRPKEYDAWNIDPYYVEKCYPVQKVTEVFCTENGSVRTVIHVVKEFCHSTITQDIIFYEASARIDFKTHIDWKESQILLKAAFPIDVTASKATYEIQYGNVERPTHANTSWEQAKFEVCAHKWADIAENGYGVSLLNDCKYGYDVKGTTMRLTLLKSGIFPNPVADREEHDFIYSIYPHQGDFREGGVIKEAYLLNCPMYALEGEALPKEQKKSFFSVLEENVILETVKPAEEGDDLILRLYEAYGRRTKTKLMLPDGVLSCKECDLLERPQQMLALEDGCLQFEVKPYEIKTFRLALK